MKKLVTLFLSVLMLTTCFIGVTATEVSLRTNIVPNADLSRVTADGLPEDMPINGLSNGSVQVADVTADDVTAGVVNNKKLVAKNNTSGSSIYVYLLPVDVRSQIVPGTEYEISFKYKSDVAWALTWSTAWHPTNLDWTSVSGAYPYVKDGEWVGKADTWTTYKLTVTMPKHKGYLQVALRLNNVGNYEFSDISVVGLKKKEGLANIAPNYNFEQLDENGLPVGYEVSIAPKEGATISTQAVQNNGPDGLKALRLATTGGNGVFSVQFDLNNRENMIPGETYRVSFQYMVNGGSHSARLISSNSKTVLDHGVAEDGITCYPTTAQNGLFYLSEENRNQWQRLTFEYKVTEYRKYHWLLISGNANGSAFALADIKVEGLRRPAGEAIEGTEVLTNGGFEGDASLWTLAGNAAITQDGTNHILSVPETTDSASISIPVDDTKEKVYSVTAKVKSSVDGAAKIWFSTGEKYPNSERKDFFFNRTLDYGYSFASTGGEWKTIKVNYYPSKFSSETIITLGCNAADATLAFDDLSVKPTKNLIGNGDFEGIPIVAKLAPTEGESAGIPLTGAPLDVTNASGRIVTTENAYAGSSVKLSTYTEGTATKRGEMSIFTRVEAGKTYKLSGYIRSSGYVDFPWVGFYTNNYYGGLLYDGGALETQAKNPITNGRITASKTDAWEYFEEFVTIPTTYSPAEGVTVNWPTQEARLRFGTWQRGTATGAIYMLDELCMVEVKEGAEFYTTDAVKLSTVPKDETVNVYYNYFSQSTDSEDVTMMIALYEMIDEKPCLVKMEMTKGSASAQKPGFIRGAIDVPNEDKDYKISAFCLDSLTGMKAMGVKSSLD